MADWLTGAGALISGLSSMFGGNNGGWSWRRQNMLNELQFARETEYNRPINQVARLREAGLNPNLLYNSISTGNATSGGSSSGSAGGSSFGERMQAFGDTLSTLGQIFDKRKAKKEAREQYIEDRNFLRQKRDIELQLDKARLNQMVQPSKVFNDNILDTIGSGVGIFSPRLGNFIRTVGRNYDVSNIPVVNSSSTPSIRNSLRKYLYSHPKVFDEMKQKGRVYSRFSDL